MRVVGGLLLALSGILNMGLFLKAGAIFVTGLTGVNDPTTVNWVMTAMIVLVIAYTSLGGIVSVIITDYVQFVVLSFGLLLACVLAVGKLGWSNIVEGVTQVHGNAGFDPFDETGFGPSYVTWMFFSASSRAPYGRRPSCVRVLPKTCLRSSDCTFGRRSDS